MHLPFLLNVLHPPTGLQIIFEDHWIRDGKCIIKYATLSKTITFCSYIFSLFVFFLSLLSMYIKVTRDVGVVHLHGTTGSFAVDK